MFRIFLHVFLHTCDIKKKKMLHVKFKHMTCIHAYFFALFELCTVLFRVSDKI